MLRFASKLTDSAESIQARLDRSLKEACEAVTNGAKAKYGTDIAIKTKRLIRTQPTEDWSFIAVVDFALAPSEHFDASEFASKIEREFHKEANTSFKLAGANVLSVDVSSQHNVAQVKASIRLKPAARPIRSETVTRLVR